MSVKIIFNSSETRMSIDVETFRFIPNQNQSMQCCKGCQLKYCKIHDNHCPGKTFFVHELKCSVQTREDKLDGIWVKSVPSVPMSDDDKSLIDAIL